MINAPSKTDRTDVSTVMPNPRIASFTEKPNLNTNVAPYLNLGYENTRHGEHYVILSGKWVALDSVGYIVPAGLAIQHEAMAIAIASTMGAAPSVAIAAAEASLGALAANNYELDKYTQVDVDNNVVNAVGLPVGVGEPVVWSMFCNTGTGIATPWDSPLVTVNYASWMTIGNHIGCAGHMLYRNSKDSIVAHATANHTPDTLFEKAVRNGAQLRNYNWEFGQDRATILVAEDVFMYPIRADRSGAIVTGQALAIAPDASAYAEFVRGAYVTYDSNSDVVAATGATLAGALDPTAVIPNNRAALSTEMIRAKARIVGQVIDVVTTYPQALLGNVMTRWDSSLAPGFGAIDAMPGTATGGLPWQMHTAGCAIGDVVLGEVKISPLMR